MGAIPRPAFSLIQGPRMTRSRFLGPEKNHCHTHTDDRSTCRASCRSITPACCANMTTSRLTSLSERYRQRLVEQLQKKGAIRSTRLAQAFARIPREEFVSVFLKKLSLAPLACPLIQLKHIGWSRYLQGVPQCDYRGVIALCWV